MTVLRLYSDDTNIRLLFLKNQLSVNIPIVDIIKLRKLVFWILRRQVYELSTLFITMCYTNIVILIGHTTPLPYFFPKEDIPIRT